MSDPLEPKPSRTRSALPFLRRGISLTALLLGVDFLDEWWSGVQGIGAPGIQTEFGLSYAMATGWLMTTSGLLSWLLEPPLFLLADRLPRRWFVCGGLGVLGALLLVAGLAPSYWVLFGALALTGVASGCGVNVAQASLMDLHPDERESMMTRWTLLGWIGDLATPTLFWLLAFAGLGWRTAMLTTGGVLVAYAAALLARAFPDEVPRARAAAEPSTGGQPEPSMREALVAALRNRQLLFWAVACSLCTLLDEILVAFGSLYLRDHLGADQAARSLVIWSFMAGGILGLLVADRVLARMEPLRLLKATAALGAVAYAGWIVAPNLPASALALFVLGALAASFYPIVKAQAYRALPGRSSTVNAVTSLLAPLDHSAPFLLGLVADRFGLVPVMWILIAEPIGLLMLAIAAGRRSRAPR